MLSMATNCTVLPALWMLLLGVNKAVTLGTSWWILIQESHKHTCWTIWRILIRESHYCRYTITLGTIWWLLILASHKHTVNIIDVDDVKKRLNNLNVYNSYGPEILHPRILKALQNKIALPLKLIVECLLTEN